MYTNSAAKLKAYLPFDTIPLMSEKRPIRWSRVLRLIVAYVVLFALAVASIWYVDRKAVQTNAVPAPSTSPR
jgi:hypothetical protein